VRNGQWEENGRRVEKGGICPMQNREGGLVSIGERGKKKGRGGGNEYGGRGER